MSGRVQLLVKHRRNNILTRKRVSNVRIMVRLHSVNRNIPNQPKDDIHSDGEGDMFGNDEYINYNESGEFNHLENIESDQQPYGNNRYRQKKTDWDLMNNLIKKLVYDGNLDLSSFDDGLV